MKCDQCESEATVHELRVVSGKRVERHLCEKCAREQGIAIQQGMSVPELIEKMLEQSVQSAQPPSTKAAKPEPTKAAACTECGTTYTEFRQSGLLGCPECYKCFEAQLGPLLERAHEGGTHHVGKLPKQALRAGAEPAPTVGIRKIGQVGGKKPVGAESVLGGPEQRAGRIAALRKQLEEAVRTEQYERAAKIRDELRRLAELEGMPPGQSGAA
jgi:protein arginine kinase activator